MLSFFFLLALYFICNIFHSLDCIADMPPERPTSHDVLTAHPGEALYLDWVAEGIQQERGRAVATAVEHPTLRWVDLPPEVLPLPRGPPDGPEVQRVEDIVTPDKKCL